MIGDNAIEIMDRTAAGYFVDDSFPSIAVFQLCLDTVDFPPRHSSFLLSRNTKIDLPPHEAQAFK